MLGLQELMRVNFKRQVHSYQIFPNGFLGLCTVDGTCIKTPIYNAAGGLIPNSDRDPFETSAASRAGVYMNVDVGAGKILRVDEIDDALNCDETYKKYYALDFHGNIIVPYVADAKIFDDVPQVPTRITDIPKEFAQVAVGHMANDTINFCMNMQFYQVPTQEKDIIATRSELLKLGPDTTLQMEDYVYLESYSRILQAVDNVVSPGSDNLIQYAQLRNAITKNYMWKQMVKAQ